MPGAGRYRHRVTIQQATKPQDSYGQPQKNWIDLTTIWASVEPLVGKEGHSSEASQILSQHTTLIKTRYKGELDTQMRILFKGEAFNITSIQNMHGRSKEFHLYCERIAGHEQ